MSRKTKVVKPVLEVSEKPKTPNPKKAEAPDRCVIRVELSPLSGEPALSEFGTREEYRTAHDAWEQKRIEQCPIVLEVAKRLEKAKGSLLDCSHRLGLFSVNLPKSKTEKILEGLAGVKVYPEMLYEPA